MDFYSAIAEYYDDIFPIDKKQVEFIKKLNNKKSCKILDCGCATGNLALALAECDFLVTALDNNQAMLSIAQEKIRHKTQNIDFINIDLLKLKKIFRPESFDCLLCLGNTLAHLADEAAIADFLAQSYDLMKKYGKLLIQILNYDLILDKQKFTLPIIETDKLIFTRNNLLSSGKIIFAAELYLKNKKVKLSNKVELIPLRKEILNKQLTVLRFKNICCYSDYEKNAYNYDSLPLIISAEK